MHEIRVTIHLPGRDVGAGFDSLADLAAIAVPPRYAVTVQSPLRLTPEQLAGLAAPPALAPLEAVPPAPPAAV